MTYIEGATATVAEIAKLLEVTPAAVEAEAVAVAFFVGEDWAGRRAVSAADAAGLVSGAARREQGHDAAWRRHVAAVEQHETEREAVRVAVFQESYDVAMRRGSGNAAASEVGHLAARDALRDWDAANRVPRFEAPSSSPASWFTKATRKVKASI